MIAAIMAVQPHDHPDHGGGGDRGAPETSPRAGGAVEIGVRDTAYGVSHGGP
jgi:hypothetical protein